ncbi:MAG: CpaF family protein [Acidimicrobiia bacterium]
MGVKPLTGRVIDRLVDTLVASNLPLERETLERATPRLAAVEAPLAGPGVMGQVVDALVGLGPIEVLLRDPTVTDVLVNGPYEVWVERAGRLEPTAVRFSDERALVAAVERVISPLGLRLDQASPMVDARLADGSRLHASIPPVAVDHPVVAVRRFTPAVPDLEALVEAKSIGRETAELLRRAVVERRNLVVAGGTGAGKTTLLNVLSAEIPAGERVVTIEDAAELQLQGHVVRLEARPANVEGAGEVTLRRLVRSALRLRPDRLVVGEVRGPEALDLIWALNTGHGGSLSTVHANSPDEALWRLETLALSGPERVGEEAVRRQLVAALDLIVQVERRDGRRRVCAVAEVTAGGCREVVEC